MTTTRRLLLQAGALLPFAKARAARKSTGIYAQLGIRPLINFTGTHTTIGASKIWDEIHESMADASREYVYLSEVQEKVGERLARWALNRDYGFKDVVPSGPIYSGHRVEGDRIVVSFDFADGGHITAQTVVG